MEYERNESIEKAKNQLVIKDNRLIQNILRENLKKEVYKLTLSEQKALAYIISLIKKPEESKADPIYEYSIDIKLFCSVCGINNYSGRNKKTLEKALTNLASNGIWITTPNNGEMYLQWITTPEIKGDCIEITIPRKTMPYLYNLHDNFTQYELEQILFLKGKYSIALFELLKSNSYKQSFVISINDYRNYLGIENTKYEQFKELRRWTIDRPLKEINETPTTGIKADWKPIREGRSYTALKFFVREKTAIEKHNERASIENNKRERMIRR